MNKTVLFLQADLHRAINSNQRDLVVSVLDLAELIAAVAKAEGREQSERIGHQFAFIRPEKLDDLKGGKRMYCTVRLRKNDEFSEPIFCIPKGQSDVDVGAGIDEDTSDK